VNRRFTSKEEIRPGSLLRQNPHVADIATNEYCEMSAFSTIILFVVEIAGSFVRLYLSFLGWNDRVVWRACNLAPQYSVPFLRLQ
jgi:hypothetical protein